MLPLWTPPDGSSGRSVARSACSFAGRILPRSPLRSPRSTGLNFDPTTWFAAPHVVSDRWKPTISRDSAARVRRPSAGGGTRFQQGSWQERVGRGVDLRGVLGMDAQTF